jgi:iron complex transport system substrate-binding protein
LRRLRITRRVLLAAALGAAASGARAQPASRRIVSVGGALTETLFALDAQAELVGVDTTSFYPEAARALPNVGYARALSAEGVLSLRPTLLLATEEAGPPAVLRQLQAARVPLQVLDSDHRFEGMVERCSRVAVLVGRDAAGRVLAERLRSDWQAAQLRVAALRQGPPPRVLFVLSHGMGQVRVAGDDTGAAAVIHYAGARNALAGGFSGYKPLTPEAVIAAAPDVILSTEQGLAAAAGIDGLLRLPGLAQTPAGQARRVLAFDALLLLGFGPRLPQAVVALAEALQRARKLA